MGTSGADGFVIWCDFYERVRKILEYLAARSPRPAGYTKDDARDYNAFLRTIAGKKGARLNVRRAKFHKREGTREILAEFDFDEKDVSTAHMRLGVDISNFEQNASAAYVLPQRTERDVPFIWYRTDREKGKASGQTSDRGIIAKVSEKPLPVYFASEIENQKDTMTKSRRNPFALVYKVDVAVEYDERGEPRSYTILNINMIIEGGEG